MGKIIDEENTEAIRWQVAEKLGWRNTEYSVAGLFIGHPPGRKALRVVPSYAVDIKATWEIIEYLAGRQIDVDIKHRLFNRYVHCYHVVIGDETKPLGKATNRKAAMAVCLAFLEVPEDVLRPGHPLGARAAPTLAAGEQSGRRPSEKVVSSGDRV